MKLYDAIIVGAGPAGLACAAELAAKGLEAAVLDEQSRLGGQIYRNITGASPEQCAVLGPDYTYGRNIARAFAQAGPDYFPRARVWQAEPTGDVYFSRNGSSRRLRGRFLVLGTGAMERPVPFPGWTLPGVMTCGGISNLYKDSGLVPKEPVVLAGSGPLLWLVAEHLLALRAPVAALLDTTDAPLSRLASSSPALPGAMLRFGYLAKGLVMIAKVLLAARKAGVPVYRGVSGLQAEGDERVRRVRAICSGKALSFETSVLAVHEGIIPNAALPRQAGCAHVWDGVQRFWHPAVDADGRSSQPAIFVSGDGAFVHGARAAVCKGRLAALRIAREMHRISAKEHREQSLSVRRELRAELLPRPFIDRLYAPRADLYALADETVICRCEGVTAGRVRELVRQGLTDHNEIKSILRCGMGPCQGRMCGSAVLDLVAQASGLPPQDVRPFRLRPPVKPVSLQEMASAVLEESDER